METKTNFTLRKEKRSLYIIDYLKSCFLYLLIALPISFFASIILLIYWLLVEKTNEIRNIFIALICFFVFVLCLFIIALITIIKIYRKLFSDNNEIEFELLVSDEKIGVRKITASKIRTISIKDINKIEINKETIVLYSKKKGFFVFPNTEELKSIFEQIKK